MLRRCTRGSCPPRSARAYPPHCQDLLRPRVRRLRPHSRTRPAVVPDFRAPPWGPLPKAPPQASLLRVPAPLLPRDPPPKVLPLLRVPPLRRAPRPPLPVRAHPHTTRSRADARRACRRPGSPGSGRLPCRRYRRCRQELRPPHPPPEPEPAAYSTPYCKAASGRAVVFSSCPSFPLALFRTPRKSMSKERCMWISSTCKGVLPWLPIPDPAGSDR